MKRCPGMIAALPRELSLLVKGWRKRELDRNVWVWTNGQAVAACAGMGRARGEKACRAALDTLPVTDMISVGLAGGCDPEFRVGEIVRAGVVVDAATEERFEVDRQGQVLVSSSVIASVSGKAALRAQYGAAAVDMEGATVARFARQHGLNFSAIKAISDEAEFEIGDLSQFATEDGQFKEAAFALHAALRPAMWCRVMAMGRNGTLARRALTEALRVELDWYRTQG
ncbi:MAG TPA: phosphorylase [Acidobacteriaceae bacterium]|nr:phosphorylase [Acidobacteriaceae bacterium]